MHMIALLQLILNHKPCTVYQLTSSHEGASNVLGYGIIKIQTRLCRTTRLFRMCRMFLIHACENGQFDLLECKQSTGFIITIDDIFPSHLCCPQLNHFPQHKKLKLIDMFAFWDQVFTEIKMEIGSIKIATSTWQTDVGTEPWVWTAPKCCWDVGNSIIRRRGVFPPHYIPTNILWILWLPFTWYDPKEI